MSLREKINENPGVVAAVTVGLVVLLLLYMAWSFFGGSGAQVVDEPKVFILNPDGQSWEAKPRSTLLEVDASGNPPVMVKVYKKQDGTEVVAWYERYHPDAITAIKRLEVEQTPQSSLQKQQIMQSGRQLSTDGKGNWIAATQGEGRRLQQAPKGEDGQFLELVNPDE